MRAWAIPTLVYKFKTKTTEFGNIHKIKQNTSKLKFENKNRDWNESKPNSVEGSNSLPVHVALTTLTIVAREW
jgi:hypothetical protein